MILSSVPVGEQRLWRNLFLFLCLGIVVLLPALSHAYGQTGDEWLQAEYGRDIWNYFVHGNQRALDYSNTDQQHLKQEFYGGLFDFPMHVLHEWFPSIPLLKIRHFFNALTGALMMVFTGMLAVRISRNWMLGTLALLFMLFSPRIFGESMNNPKDIPFACGFIVGIYFLVAFLQDFPNRLWRHAAGLALGWGFAFGVRSAGGILLLAYVALFALLYYVLNKDFQARLKADSGKLLKKGALALGVALLAGYAIGLAAWPWGLQSPIANPLESLRGMTNRQSFLRVLFEGRYRMNDTMPWYYEFKWILISSPLIIMAGIALCLLFVGRVRRQHGLFYVALLLFGALFPLLYAIYKHSTVYDTWRHMFFVYPFWVILSVLGWGALQAFVGPRFRWVPLAAALLGLLPAVVWTVRSHPNQYVYFNELVGGLKGAHGVYETDYYQNSGLQAAEWVRKNAKRSAGRKVMVRSNLSNIAAYFDRDTAWLVCDYGRYPERSTKDWDYFIAYSRYVDPGLLQDGAWPPKNTVHTVAVDGVPLMAVLYRPFTTDGIAAFQALERKDYATAAARYARYVQADPYDEMAFYYQAIALANAGQIDAALAAANRARQLNPFAAQMHQLAAELYSAKGDTRAAQDAQNQAATLSSEDESSND